MKHTKSYKAVSLDRMFPTLKTDETEIQNLFQHNPRSFAADRRELRNEQTNDERSESTPISFMNRLFR